jgi:hypothetical protein
MESIEESQLESEPAREKAEGEEDEELPERVRMDLVAGLPVELSERILSNLGPEDLCVAAQVSKAWYVLANEDRLWRKLCQEMNVQELSPPKPGKCDNMFNL